jgi:hypothetical protein
MKKHYLVACAVIVVLITAVLSLTPVPITSEADCKILNATVADVYEQGTNDVVLKLQGDDRTFYVNRGLERGLNLQKLKTELIGREITLKYPDYWTPLDPGKTSIHVSKIEVAGRTVFTELTK